MTKQSKRMSLLVVAILIVSLSPAAGKWATQAQEPPEPLPRDCDAVTPPGGNPPACCVYGYVYYDGAPVAGANVTVRSAHGFVNLTTTDGPISSYPYYATGLSDAPLSVTMGEMITVTGTYSGTGGSRVHQVVTRGQQVDVTCFPIVVPNHFVFLPIIVKSR